MKRSGEKLMRKYVERWRRAGPELEVVRRRELNEFDHAANWRLIDGLLAAGLRFARPHSTSGLVEMQKWFMELAKRQGVLPTKVREESARPSRRR